MAKYDPNKDYSLAIEQAKAAGQSTAQLEAERAAKIADMYAGVEPTYGNTGQTYSQYSAPQKTVPAGFTGSATGVGTYTQDQDAIKAQMNANSKAWHTASAEEQERLHQENQQLAALLGGSVGFDSVSGTWSGSAQKPVQQVQVEDYSSYLEDMYAAQKRKSLAELNAAYEKNVNALDRAGVGVAEQYQAARNNTAGASELAKRNFAEYAAANGLNSGAGGQAELSRNVTLQNNLNNIDTAEADTVADLELQRANAETEYNNAIAQAEASGDYALASALYQEKVRVQELLLQQQYQQYQMDYQAQRDQVSDSQWQQQFDLQQKDSLAGYGQAFLKQGLMPSDEMLNAMGITAQDAQNYITALKAQAVQAGGDSGGSDDSGSGADWDGLFAAAMQSGHPQSFIANNYKSYGFTSSSGLWSDYQDWEANGGAGVVPDQAYQFARFLYESTENADYVYKTLKANGYSDSEIDQLMAQLGL